MELLRDAKTKMMAAWSHMSPSRRRNKRLYSSLLQGIVETDPETTSLTPEVNLLSAGERGDRAVLQLFRLKWKEFDQDWSRDPVDRYVFHAHMCLCPHAAVACGLRLLTVVVFLREATGGI